MIEPSKIKHVLSGALLTGLLAISSNSYGANWLALQGTEAEGAERLAKVWGFVQAQYQEDNSDPNGAGAYIPPKLINADFESQSQFNVNRARIGVRGVAMPIDQKVNYFLLLEMGNNGITEPGNSFTKATDASITLNHLKGARVRAGLFKYPGAEEGLQAIHVFDYINFTWVTGQMLLERSPNRFYIPNLPAQPLPPIELNGFENGVGAFRDVGVQVFDWFNVGNNWELAYAVMYGNGNGLNFGDNDDNKDTYLYFSAEKVFGGAGPRRQGLKFFGWSQSGKRTADLSADSCINPLATFPACGPAGSGRISTIHNPVEYDRDRYGFGFKFLRNGWRATAEYMKGEGMIWQAPHNPTFGIGPGQGIPVSLATGGEQAGNGALAEASGYYVEGGWRIPKSKWELDLRYDQYNRLDGNQFEIEFKRTTFGVQYFFNPRVRVALNYEARSGEAVNFGPGAGPNGNVDGIDDRIGIQVTAIWSQ